MFWFFFLFFSYGFAVNPTIEKPLILSGDECVKLNREGVFKFEGQEIKIKSVKSFSADITLKGSYREIDGTCKNGIPFSYGGTFYPSNWMVGRITGKSLRLLKLSLKS